VRDILVEKEDRDKHELRAVKTLNRYFNAVLVHADPLMVKISETFDHFNQIRIPVDYTGYIAPKPAADAGKMIRRQLKIGEEENLIIASAGGGNVGAPILTAAVRAFSLLAEKNRCHLKVFTGPFLDQSEFDRLKRCAGNNVQVTRFARDFLSYLAAADLSVSMGGYNTTMNILASGTPALVWPFGQNREQRLRASRLASLGVLQVLEDEDLDPDRLAAIMNDWMSRSIRPAVNINLNGAANTARWIETAIKR
jgi:predicted glycosyltransferase